MIRNNQDFFDNTRKIYHQMEILMLFLEVYTGCSKLFETIKINAYKKQIYQSEKNL